MPTRKRPRQSEAAATEPATQQPTEQAADQQAECPFSAQIVAPDERPKKGAKRRRNAGSITDNDPDIKFQESPFRPAGVFKTYKTLDSYYRVSPAAKWSEMTRYNSFVRKLHTLQSLPSSHHHSL